MGLGAAALPRLDPELRAERPQAVLVTGLAGGCAPSAAPGEVVVGTVVGPTATGTWLSSDAALVSRALRVLREASLPHQSGRLLTVPEVVTTLQAKGDCWRRHDILAADMESAHVLAWAAQAGLPALAVRAVADGPADTLPPALVGAVTAGGAVQLGTVLGWVRRPTLLGAAWRLWRRSSVALDRLARFLAAFTAAPVES